MAAAVFEMQYYKTISSDPALEERIQLSRGMLETKTVIVTSQCAKYLDELDTDRDLYVSAEEWQAAENYLPSLYGVLLACFVGITESSRVGQFADKVSVEEPVKEKPPPVIEAPPSPPRRFTLDDLRKNKTFACAMASVDTN